jgi:hypothetical protein
MIKDEVNVQLLTNSSPNIIQARVKLKLEMPVPNGFKEWFQPLS